MTFRKIMFFLIPFFLFFGCSKKWEYRPITSTDDLEGRVIGVPLAWDADYYMSSRKDSKVVRYNTCADGFLALRHNKIDAFAVDNETAKVFMATGKGLRMITPVGKSHVAVWFTEQSKHFMEEFNEFLKTYRESEKYKDLRRRKADFDGENFESDNIQLTGTGKVFRIVFDDQEFPRAYKKDDGVPAGIDLEALKYFSNEHNYKIEFHNAAYEAMIVGMGLGKYDAAAGYLCDLFKEDAKECGILVSDPIDEIDIALVEKTKEDIDITLDF